MKLPYTREEENKRAVIKKECILYTPYFDLFNNKLLSNISFFGSNIYYIASF